MASKNRPRVEVVMACREEVPANAERTIANVLETMGPDDRLSVVLDGAQSEGYAGKGLTNKRVNLLAPWSEPRGCGQARHFGITQSRAAVVVLIDAHMTFPAGWLDVHFDHIKANPHALTCCRMQSLDYSWNPIPGQVYAGAHLETHCAEDGHQFWAIAAKWNRTDIAGGEVGAVMGACYGIARDWYEEIGRPLRILEAWGGDEEILSLATALMGGECWLLPLVAGHVYAAPRVKPIAATPTERAAVWGNRFAILQSLPLPADVASELDAWLRQNQIRHDEVAASVERRRRSIDSLAAVLSAGPLDWDELLDSQAVRRSDGTKNPKTPPLLAGDTQRTNSTPAPKLHTLGPTYVTEDTAAQVVVRQAPKPLVCERCDAVGQIVQNVGMHQRGAFRVAYSKCKRCGHKVNIREIPV